MADTSLTRCPCPCCGFLTVEDPGRFDICAVCFWEDDVIQLDDPAYAGGANEMCLDDAQVAYQQIGVISERYREYVRLPTPEEIPHMPQYQAENEPDI